MTNRKFQNGQLLTTKSEWEVLAALDSPEQDHTLLFTVFIR